MHISLVLSMLLAHGAFAAPPQQPSNNNLQLLEQRGNYSTFIELARISGYASFISSTNNLTIFAPSNQAFEQLPSAVLGVLKLPALAAVTRAILSYHVSPQLFMTSDIQQNDTFQWPTELIGFNLTMSRNETGIFVNDAQIVDPDVPLQGQSGQSGILQGINRVLNPAGVPTRGITAPLEALLGSNLLPPPFNMPSGQLEDIFGSSQSLMCTCK